MMDVSEPGEDSEKKFKTFVSYSRSDLELADQVSAVLAGKGIDVLIDRDNIAPAEKWQGRLVELIGESDCVLFIQSDRSAMSEACRWEIECALKKGKRIVVLSHGKPSVHVQKEIDELNWIFTDDPGLGNTQPSAPTENALSKLIYALSVDISWVREHSRLSRRAQEWDDAGRAEDRLMRKGDAASARAWANLRPDGDAIPRITGLISDYISASEEHEIVMDRRLRRSAGIGLHWKIAASNAAGIHHRALVDCVCAAILAEDPEFELLPELQPQMMEAFIGNRVTKVIDQRDLNAGAVIYRGEEDVIFTSSYDGVIKRIISDKVKSYDLSKKIMWLNVDPCGEWLFAGDINGSLHCLDLKTERWTSTSLEDGVPIRAIQYFPEQNIVVAGGQMGFLWEVSLADMSVRPLHGGGSATYCDIARISEQLTYAIGKASGELEFRTVGGEKPIATVDIGGRVNAVSYSEHRQQIVAASMDGRIVVLDPQGNQINAFHDPDHEIISVSWGGVDDDRILAGTVAGKILIFAASDLQPEWEEIGLGNPVNRLVQSGDPGKILACSAEHVFEVDLRTSFELTRLNGGLNQRLDSRNNLFVEYSSVGWTAKIRSFADGSQLGNASLARGCADVAISSDDRYIAFSSNYPGVLLIADLKKGEMRHTINLERGFSADLKFVNSDRTILATLHNLGLCLIDVTSGETVTYFEMNDCIGSHYISREDLLLAMDARGKIVLSDCLGNIENQLLGPENCTQFELSDGEKYLLAHGQEDRLHLWDLSDENPTVRHLDIEVHYAKVSEIHGVLLCSDRTGNLRCFDLSSLEPLWEAYAPAALSDLQFHPELPVFLIGCVNGSVGIRHLSSGESLISFATPGQAARVSFSRDYKTVRAQIGRAIVAWDIRRLQAFDQPFSAVLSAFMNDTGFGRLLPGEQRDPISSQLPADLPAAFNKLMTTEARSAIPEVSAILSDELNEACYFLEQRRGQLFEQSYANSRAESDGNTSQQ